MNQGDGTLERVALLTDGIHPLVVGGMQKHSFYLLQGLLRKGVQVLLFHTNPQGKSISGLLTDSEQEGLEEVMLYFPKHKRIPGAYVKASYTYSKRIAREMMEREPVQFIYAQGFTAWAWLEKRAYSAPVGLNFHGLEMFQVATGARQRLIQRLFKPIVLRNLRKADVAYSLGGKLTDILKRVLPDDGIEEIPIGIGETWLKDSSALADKDYSKAKGVFIGRNERRKGLKELYEALDMEPMSVDFIGPIPKSEQKKMDGLTYHGSITDEAKMKSIIDGCSVLLCPSLSEGMPTVVLEAMSRGLAILGSDVGAMGNMVDDSNGWLVPAGDVSSLVLALRKVNHTEPPDLAKMGEISHQRVKASFLWDTIVELNIHSMMGRIRMG